MEQTKKGKCPVFHGTNTTTEQNHQHWWPNALNLDILAQNDKKEIRWMPALVIKKNFRK
jgi:catalase-peroxidase